MNSVVASEFKEIRCKICDKLLFKVKFPKLVKAVCTLEDSLNVSIKCTKCKSFVTFCLPV